MTASDASFHGLPRPPQSDGLLELKSMGLALRRQWWKALIVAALTAGVLWIGYALFPFSYKATAAVMLDPRMQNVAPGETVLAGFGSDPAAVESQAQYMQSPAFVWEVIARQKLDKDSEFTRKISFAADDARWKDALVARFLKQMTVARKGLTYVIEVSFKDKTPERAASFANAIAETYVALQQETRQELAREARQWVDERVFVLTRKARASDGALADFKKQLGLVAAGEGNTTRERLLTDLTQQLSLAQAEAAAAQARLSALRGSDPRRVALDSEDFQSPTLTNLRTQYASLTQHAAEVATVYGEKHPQFMTAHLRLESLNRQISQEVTRLGQKQKNEWEQARGKALLLEKRLNALAHDDADFVKLAELERIAGADRTLLEQYLARQQDLAQKENLVTDDVSILSRALPPAQSTKPKLPLALGGIAFLALACGVAFGLLQEGRAGNRIFSQEQVQRAGLDVLAFLPRPAASGTDDTYQSAIRHVMPAMRGVQVALVVPLHPRVQAAHFSRALVGRCVQAGQSVLVLAFSPAEGNAPDRRGLSDAVWQGASLAEITQRLDCGADCMVLGKLPDAASYEHLLNDERVRIILERSMAQYDTIIIETPSPLMLAATPVLLESADRLFLLPLWGESTVADLEEAEKLLAQGERPIMRVVMAQTDFKKLPLYDPEAARLLHNSRI